MNSIFLALPLIAIAATAHAGEADRYCEQVADIAGHAAAFRAKGMQRDDVLDMVRAQLGDVPSPNRKAVYFAYAEPAASKDYQVRIAAYTACRKGGL